MSETQSIVEKWWKKSVELSTKSNDALVTLFMKGFETMNVVLLPTLDNERIVRAITSLDNERKLSLQFEKNNTDIIRYLSFGFMECLQVLLEAKGKIYEDHMQILTEATSTLEKWRIQSSDYFYSSNDVLVTLLAKAFDTIAVVLSPTSDNARIEHFITSLDNERKLSLRSEKTDFDILRYLSFGLIESLQVVLEAKGKINEVQNQILTDQQPFIDDFTGVPLFKEEAIDFGFDALESALLVENSSYEVPLNDSRGQIPPSDEMADDMISMEDPIIVDRNSTSMENKSVNNQSSRGEHRDDSSHIEKIDGANVSMEGNANKRMNHSRTPAKYVEYTESDDEHLEKKQSDKPEVKFDDKRRIDRGQSSSRIDAVDMRMRFMRTPPRPLHAKDSMAKTMTVRPNNRTPKKYSTEIKRVEKSTSLFKTPSRPVNFNKSLDKWEPIVMKSRAKSVKKMDVTRTPSKSSKGSVRPNHTQLECPHCEHRTFSVGGWCQHLKKMHDRTPRELRLALRCECGTETFSVDHSLMCDVSKITIIHKIATPQGVMCEEQELLKNMSGEKIDNSAQTEIIGQGKDLVEKEAEKNKTVRPNYQTPMKGSSSIVGVEKRMSLFKTPSRPTKYTNQWESSMKKQRIKSEMKLDYCVTSKITVVEKTLNPQCVMCEAYPRTAPAYAQHLTFRHNTTLIQLGIFLTCSSCGYKVRSNTSEHAKKCSCCDFTLSKEEDE